MDDSWDREIWSIGIGNGFSNRFDRVEHDKEAFAFVSRARLNEGRMIKRNPIKLNGEGFNQKTEKMGEGVEKESRIFRMKNESLRGN